jgi:hypothetical protein
MNLLIQKLVPYPSGSGSQSDVVAFRFLGFQDLEVIEK